MATNESLDEVQEENAGLQTVVDEDDFVIEEFGSDSDDQATEKALEIMEPKKGMIFGSENDAIVFYKRYARKKGFAITRRSSRTADEKLRYFTLACSRQGKAQYSSKNTWKPHPSIRMQCPAKINLALYGPDDKFRLSSLTLEHNHDLSPSETTQTSVLICNKKPDLSAKRRRVSNGRAENRANKKSNSPRVQAGGYENHQVGQKEPTDNLQEERRLKLGAGDAHALYHFFFRMQSKNPNFFYVMDFDEDSRLRNVFWADARSRAAYEYFSDVMTFDSTYLTNKYGIPFASFVGVNHHGESILLGCGILSDENTETFVWFFKSWLACMSNKPPKAVITDQCKAIQDAIEEVFPQTCHRWCLWHIMKKIPEKLSGFSGFENIQINLTNVVYDSLAQSDFEKDWIEIIGKFGLQDSEWLNGLYCNRQKWVPVYVKDTFWAGMSCTHKSESINAFFDGYVNSCTTPNQFLEQYGNAIRDMVEKENNADCKSFQEVVPCITHYDIEKQFQTAYTNEKFAEFQEQLKGKIYCYPTVLKQEGSIYIFKVLQDVKIREQQISLDFTVWFNGDGCDVKCICRHFEFQGILCSHIISVLALMKIKEVPSKYVLQRWRKDLERRHSSITCFYDDMVNSPVARRFDLLCKSFYEVAEKAAASDELYDLVMDGLRELKVKVNPQRDTHEIQNSNPLENQDKEM